jgi:hypothetical protein
MYRIILFFLYSVVQYAQQPDAIIGVLLDANNQAVQGVSVSLEGTSLQQFSDTSGSFKLTLPPNTTSGTLVLTHSDFQINPSKARVYGRCMKTKILKVNR